MATKNLSLIALSLAVAAQANGSMEFLMGHVDIGVELEPDNTLHIGIHQHEDHDHDHDDHDDHDHGHSALDHDHDHDHSGEYGILVPLAVSQTLGSGIPATGVGMGEDIWVLPQSNPGTESIPFLGVSTGELNGPDWLGDITFLLGSVHSPSGNGHFSLWQSGALPGDPPGFFFSTVDPTLTERGNNTFLMGAGAGHDHFNWGFSEPGLWEIEMSAFGIHNTEGFLNATETFSFNVVPEPSSFGLLFGLAAIGFAAIRRR